MINKERYYKTMRRYFKSKGVKQDNLKEYPNDFNCDYSCRECFLGSKTYCSNPFYEIREAKNIIAEAEEAIKEVEKYDAEHSKVSNKDKLFQMLDIGIGYKGSKGVKDAGIRSYKQDDSSYCNPKPDNKKEASFFIKFETYDDLEKWLNDDYVEKDD